MDLDFKDCFGSEMDLDFKGCFGRENYKMDLDFWIVLQAK